jgi:putative membrane protein
MTPALLAAVLLLCLSWSPWARALSAHFFTAHMAVHMTVVAVAAPLLIVGLGPTRASRALAGRWLAPIPASLVELIVVWVWHVPALHHAARTQLSMLVLEQASFFVSGLLLWGSVLNTPARHLASRVSIQDQDTQAAGIVALLLTLAHMTLLGAIISLSPRPLYHHLSTDGTLLDQQIGGSLMLAVSAVAYTAGGLWLGYTSLRRDLWVRS